jgi:hypothetical protein
MNGSSSSRDGIVVPVKKLDDSNEIQEEEVENGVEGQEE